MNHLVKKFNADPSLRFLLREGEMRKRIREFNWSNTELGDPAAWPTSLKTAIAIMLDCARPAYIAWGPKFIQLYNDAYIPILGELKHPQALGLTAPETWPEIWGGVEPIYNSVRDTCRSVSMENQLRQMLRNGYLEECYVSFSCSPLTDEAGQVTGLFITPWETTLEFVSNRRKNALRMLMQGVSNAVDMQSIRAAFEKTVVKYTQDLPFALWYELRQDLTGLDLVSLAGIQRGSVLSPEFLDLERDDFYAGLINFDSPAISSRSFDADLLHWERPLPPIVNPHCLFINPLYYSNHQRPDGYLILAANPMRPNDEIQREFLLAVRLLLENAVRRVNRYEHGRRERKHQFQAIMAAMPCLVWMSDTANAFIYANQTLLDFTGRSLEQHVGNGWIESVHPDDIGEIARYYRAFEARRVLTLEYRIKHANGSYRWVLDETTPRYGMNGEFLGYIGTAIDITDRKNSEQKILSSQSELRTLYERLETVREEERRALSREVHDQLGQILSAAKIDLKLLEEDIRPKNTRLSRKNISTELQSASRTIEKALQVVKRLAFELRPPELQSQGLAAAIQWHALDFERRTKIRCSIVLAADLPELDDAIAITLFGIFQEAMTNILRHAKASKVWITLQCRGNRLCLRVRDNGLGIGPGYVRSKSSMGLNGMYERSAIVGGRLVVGPLQPSGTLVAVRVPLELDYNSSNQK